MLPVPRLSRARYDCQRITEQEIRYIFTMSLEPGAEPENVMARAPDGTWEPEVNTLRTPNVEWQEASMATGLPEVALGDTNPRYTCAICYDDRVYCERRDCCESRVCGACFTLHLETQINDGNVEIKCPSCDRPMHKMEVTQKISGHVRTKYFRFMVNKCADRYTKTCPNCCHVTKVSEGQLETRFGRPRGLEVSNIR